jgi:hypothetical protein
MNVYQMSMVAAAGMLIAMAGISKVTGDSVYPFVIGFATCIAFLVQAVRSLQKQIDELKARGEEKPSAQAQD